jgi:hypothetical protein
LVFDFPPAVLPAQLARRAPPGREVCDCAAPDRCPMAKKPAGDARGLADVELYFNQIRALIKRYG